MSGKKHEERLATHQAQKARQEGREEATEYGMNRGQRTQEIAAQIARNREPGPGPEGFKREREAKEIEDAAKKTAAAEREAAAQKEFEEGAARRDAGQQRSTEAAAKRQAARPGLIEAADKALVDSLSKETDPTKRMNLVEASYDARLRGEIGGQILVSRPKDGRQAAIAEFADRFLPERKKDSPNPGERDAATQEKSAPAAEKAAPAAKKPSFWEKVKSFFGIKKKEAPPKPEVKGLDAQGISNLTARLERTLSPEQQKMRAAAQSTGTQARGNSPPPVAKGHGKAASQGASRS